MIWLDDVECAGNETAISQCGHKGWRVTDCAHSQDAGVICMPKGKINYYMCKLSEAKSMYHVLSIYSSLSINYFL